MYDLNISRPWTWSFHLYTVNFNLHRHKADIVDRTRAYFYYLEKTSKPNEVRLVHRRNYASPRPGSPQQRPLLSPSQRPIGYKSGPNTFLFDTVLGCVYVIRGMPNSLEAAYEKSRSDLILERKNIPYEDFFKCNVDYFKVGF